MYVIPKKELIEYLYTLQGDAVALDDVSPYFEKFGDVYYINDCHTRFEKYEDNSDKRRTFIMGKNKIQEAIAEFNRMGEKQ